MERGALVGGQSYGLQGIQSVTCLCRPMCVRPCRNFRTLTAPSAVQFVSLAVEPAGEVVVAGTQDDFQVRHPGGGGAAALWKGVCGGLGTGGVGWGGGTTGEEGPHAAQGLYVTAALSANPFNCWLWVISHMCSLALAHQSCCCLCAASGVCVECEDRSSVGCIGWP